MAKCDLKITTGNDANQSKWNRRLQWKLHSITRVKNRYS
jgi:hypothetical protein